MRRKKKWSQTNFWLDLTSFSGAFFMDRRIADRNILIGMLALKQHKISQEQLNQAFNVWSKNKAISIEKIFHQEGWMTGNEADALAREIKGQVEEAGGESNLMQTLPADDGVLFQLSATTMDTDILQSVGSVHGIFTNTQNQLHSSVDEQTLIQIDSADSEIGSSPAVQTLIQVESTAAGVHDAKETDLDKTMVGGSSESSANLLDTTDETKDFGVDQTTVAEKVSPKKSVFKKPPQENKVEFRYETFFEFLPKMDYLAEGAMGAVFRAEDREFGRRVALKQVKSNRRVQLNESIQSSFFLEGEVTGRLDHPGVLPMYGLGRTPDGLPFYAMKFIGSPKFTQLIDDYHEAEAKPGRDPGQSNQEFRNLLNHLRSACLTIQYAHDNGVLHCDIKPDNIMTGEYGETYVVDWGLALLVGSLQDGLMMHTTETGTGTHPVSPRREESRAALHKDQGGSRDYIGGSPAYMSPEHHQSTADRKLADMSPACDIFSLGVTLYQILTGVVPVNAVAEEEHHRRFFRMRMADYLAPRELKPGIPKALEAICLKAIAKEPKDRYESAMAFAEDLERWQAGEPVVAYPENWLERSKRWAWRNRTTVSAIAATLLVVTFFSLLTAGLLGRKNAELALKNDQIQKQNEEILVERNRAEEHARIAEKNEQLAERREKMAVEAVKDYADAVTENVQLKNRPELEELRQKLLKSPVDFFRRLNDDFRSSNDTRPESLFSLAQGIHELAYLTNAIGNLADAGKSYNEEVKLLQDLLSKNPENREYQARLASALTELGLVEAAMGHADLSRQHQKASIERFEKLIEANPAETGFKFALAGALNSLANLDRETGNIEAARASYNRAISLRDGLVSGSPENNDFRSGLARVLTNLSVLEKNAGRADIARADYNRAIKISESLVISNPANIDYRNDLALALMNLAAIDSSTGNPAEAREHLIKAIEQYQAILKDNPTMTLYQMRQAAVLVQLGRLDAGTGNQAESRSSFSQAIETLDGLVKAYPASTEFRRGLAFALNNLGNLEQATGNPATARVNYARAVENFEFLARTSPMVVEFQNSLAAALNNMGVVETSVESASASYSRAIEIREKLAGKFPNLPDNLSDLGTSYSNLSDNTAEPARAIELLKKAMEMQLRALQMNPANVNYKNHLIRHWSKLIQQLPNLGKSEAFDEASKQLDEQIKNFQQISQLGKMKASLSDALAWFLVSEPGRKPEDYSKALEMAQAAVKTDSENGLAIRWLGAAEFRAGKYDDAIKNLTKALEQNKLVANGSEQPADLAFLAMAQWKMGRKSESQALLKRLETVMKSKPKELEKRLSSEATRLISDQASP